MNTYEIYVRTGGLMEDPIFRWTLHGPSQGETPKDAAINLFKTDSTFSVSTMTLWGWIIGYEDKEGHIIIIKP